MNFAILRHEELEYFCGGWTIVCDHFPRQSSFANYDSELLIMIVDAIDFMVELEYVSTKTRNIDPWKGPAKSM